MTENSNWHVTTGISSPHSPPLSSIWKLGVVCVHSLFLPYLYCIESLSHRHCSNRMVYPNTDYGWVTVGETIPPYVRSSHPVLRGGSVTISWRNCFAQFLAVALRISMYFLHTTHPLTSVHHLHNSHGVALPCSELGHTGPMAFRKLQVQFEFVTQLVPMICLWCPPKISSPSPAR